MFRLIAHLAKYWTAEFAVETAKWAMEVHGGLGVLQENGVERWLREAMILAIWEGTSHRQILDGLEVIERKGTHKALFQHLGSAAPASALHQLETRIQDYLALPDEDRQRGAEPLFRDIAVFAAEALLRRSPACG